MSPYTCPQGHTSEAGDYCDTCVAPIAAGPSGAGGAVAAGSGSAAAAPGGSSASAGTGGAPSAPAPVTAAPAGPRTCPSCSAPNDADALFCEACGYDFTTGAMPRPPDGAPGPDAAPDGQQPAAMASPVPPPVALEWVAEVWVDPDWYAAQESEDACPSPGPPTVVPLTAQSVLVGRRSVSRNIHPQVDCSADTGVSRRQAQLTTDGQRWWVEDLQSSNGTYVGPASGPLPENPLPPGQRHEVDEDQRVYIGAWTRLVIRRATDEEKAARA
ncbi:MAG: FHA domain-containing protein [Oryzihumus sp.]